MDKAAIFSALSPGEIAAARAIVAPGRLENEVVAQVPTDVSSVDVEWKGRKPDEVFWFRDGAGARLFAECRWNLVDHKKVVRPACYTDRGWRLIAPPAPRPIFNLDKLIARPSDTVWLFEGPRKAERAEAYFRTQSRVPALAVRKRSDGPSFRLFGNAR